MSPPLRHLLRQGPVIGALLRTGLSAQRPGPLPELPTPALSATVPARPRALVDDFLRHIGGDPRAWSGQLPPHLFPQWGLPLLTRTLHGLPYDLRRALNAGCRVEVHRPLPMGETLHLRARIEAIDDDGRRARITQSLWTGTRSAPDAVHSALTVFVPLQRSGRGSRDKPRVPAGIPEVARWRIGLGAGRQFAALTGDINPIHWLGPAARAAGFPRVILHGFATFARAVEGLNRQVFSGDVHRLRAIEARFTRPLVLPAQVGLFAGPGVYAVGTHPDGPSFLEGTWETDR